MTEERSAKLQLFISYRFPLNYVENQGEFNQDFVGKDNA